MRSRLRGAGDLLALVGARGQRRAAQRARRRPAAAPEERRRRDGDVRARLSVGEGRANTARRDSDRSGNRTAQAVREQAAASRCGWTAGTKTTPPPARRSPTPPITSITSRKSRASITSASAATSTASRACPVGLEDVSKYPALTAELLRRGYKDDEIKKILGLNILRVMRQVEKVSAKLQKERAASPMLFTK